MEPVWLFSFGRSQKDVRLVDCDVTSCIFQIKEDWLKAEKIQKQIKAKYEKNVKKNINQTVRYWACNRGIAKDSGFYTSENLRHVLLNLV